MNPQDEPASAVSRVQQVVRVLLIEDNDLDAERTARLLRKMVASVEVERSATLTEGFAAIERNPPSVVLLDLHLPDAVRLEGPTRLLDAYRSVPLVVLTGLHDRELSLQAIDLGAQDFLNKDALDAELLERTIRHAIARQTVMGRLQESLQHLESSDHEFDGFASAVAHDLRSPVRTARLLADRLVSTVRSDTGDPHDLAGRLDVVLGRLDEVILSMLDYTGQRSSDRSRELVLLGPLVVDVCQALQADLEAQEGAVTIDIPDDLAVSGTSILIWRVIENLVANSTKYRSTSTLKIAISAQAFGDRVSITVKDNGIGIPTDKRDQVFQMLHQLDDTAGQGIGLSVCRQIINSLYGSIWVEPDAGDGTEVKIDLPRAWVVDAGMPLAA